MFVLAGVFNFLKCFSSAKGLFKNRWLADQAAHNGFTEYRIEFLEAFTVELETLRVAVDTVFLDIRDLAILPGSLIISVLIEVRLRCRREVS